PGLIGASRKRTTGPRRHPVVATADPVRPEYQSSLPPCPLSSPPPWCPLSSGPSSDVGLSSTDVPGAATPVQRGSSACSASSHGPLMSSTVLPVASTLL